MSCTTFIWLLAALRGHAAGVTIITHGYSGDVNGWVTGMADRVPVYSTFPGTNFTTYKLTFTASGNNFAYQWSRTNGSPPSLTDSGEVVIKLDWSAVAGGVFAITQSTSNVAAAVSTVLLMTNAISELNGHAVAEFPMHLIGHSRGGSLISEISRLLGTNGVWVDHLSTLDPHPVNNDGFNDFPTGVDAPVRTYENVLFHDNDWQDLGGSLTVPNGEPVFGAYIRQLTSLSGGYSSSHSDVHLWYHGTLDWRVPTSDTEASLTGTERQTWWTAYEKSGTNAGFIYSLIGGSDRLATNQPVGPGFGAIRDGFNQMWDLGGGTFSNRTSLTANNGGWPNLIRFNRNDTNTVAQGQSTAVTYYYQWAQPSSSNATVSFYLDADANPLNTNQTFLKQIIVPGTGAAFVNLGATTLPLDATNAPPGRYRLFAKITASGRTRYLYAPETIQVVPARTPPTLDIARLNGTQFVIGVNSQAGQTVVLQDSTNLVTWSSIATNSIGTNRWSFTNTPPAGSRLRFYRALVP